MSDYVRPAAEAVRPIPNAGAQAMTETTFPETRVSASRTQFPTTSAADVGRLVAEARVAQRKWEAMGFSGRREVLLSARRLMVEDAERFINVVIEDTGKPYEEAQIELFYAVSALDYWAKHARRLLKDQRIRSHSPMMIGKSVRQRFEPIGAVGVIGPWNVPIVNSFGDCIPALAAGNAVVLKPSEVTPSAALAVKDLLALAGLPDGVFAVATGDGSTGSAVVDHVDFVHFTGSESTGRRVATRAAERLIPVSLELGGNDPVIVLPGADLERAASAAVFYSMYNAGQICMSIERAYVHEDIFDEFVELVVEKVRELRVGSPGGPGSVEIGAMIAPTQPAIVKEHIADAVTRGATVRIELPVPDGDEFVSPTVLVDVDHSMRLMKEETFGPTLPIMRVRDAAEAVALANDSSYGLSASVFARSRREGQEVARQLHAGTVSVNDAWTSYFAFEVPMGGAKDSGLGHRHGPDGIRKYCRDQIVVTTLFSLKHEFHWFPHSGGSARLLRNTMRTLHGKKLRGSTRSKHKGA